MRDLCPPLLYVQAQAITKKPHLAIPRASQNLLIGTGFRLALRSTMNVYMAITVYSKLFFRKFWPSYGCGINPSSLQLYIHQ